MDLANDQSCKTSCETMEYTNLLSRSNWPLKSSIITLYKQYIKSHRISKYFKIYENLPASDVSKTNLLENNLIKVSFFFFFWNILIE